MCALGKEHYMNSHIAVAFSLNICSTQFNYRAIYVENNRAFNFLATGVENYYLQKETWQSNIQLKNP